ncbi:MAG TPA: polyphosphate kinase [Bdellovibrionota bacterium]|nr:polyphosphate kinase [Bdellovibrionota bacterium]
MKLSRLLKSPPRAKEPSEKDLEALQLRMLRIQQAIWHQKLRAVIVLEGFDASGKGGAIRAMTETLDPRSFRVHPVGPPSIEEKAGHWLQRFWLRLPRAGRIAIFDRSWYGRVLVERVEKLAPRKRLKEAYREINRFEEMLVDDGIDVVKIFLAVSRKEQLARFKARLEDPYKHWKLTPDDLRARARWDDYVEAVDRLLEETHTKGCPWTLVPSDNKEHARAEVLRTVTASLKHCESWIEEQATRRNQRELKKALRSLS